MTSNLIWKHGGWLRSPEGAASWGRALVDTMACLEEGDVAFAAALIEGHSMADAVPLFRAHRFYTPNNSPGLPPHAEPATPFLTRAEAMEALVWGGLSHTSAALALLRATGRAAGTQDMGVHTS